MDVGTAVLPVGTHDVIVLGGGTAGAVAAIQAGRVGAKTLLPEGAATSWSPAANALAAAALGSVLVLPRFMHGLVCRLMMSYRSPQDSSAGSRSSLPSSSPL